MIIMSDIAHQNLNSYPSPPLRIVLVEPAGGLNVGAIARVMKNMGLFHLTLVSPKCDPVGEDAYQMAVHADDLLRKAQVVSTVPEALQGCQRVVATTARDRDLNVPVDPPHIGLRWLLGSEQPSDMASNRSSEPTMALLFGPEDRGLSNAELIYAQRLITIPTNPAYASLNLGQAVALCCYELRQILNPDLFQRSEPLEASRTAGQTSPSQQTTEVEPTDITEDIAPFEMLEGYYQQLETVLLKIGYLYPHTAKRRMEKFRLLFNRSNLSPNEVAMLRGILRQIEWALPSSAKKSEN